MHVKNINSYINKFQEKKILIKTRVDKFYNIATYYHILKLCLFLTVFKKKKNEFNSTNYFCIYLYHKYLRQLILYFQ